MIHEYSICEVWGSTGAPSLAYVKATSAIAACVSYLTWAGYEARETDAGMVSDADAPRVVAYLVTRNVMGDAADRTLARMLAADFIIDLSLATIPAPAMGGDS